MRLPRRNRFRPAAEGLEGRSVLSHSSATFSVLTSGFHPSFLEIRRNKPAAPVALINQAFTLFQQDYNQARSLYDNQVLQGTAQPVDQTAFLNYTNQRVNLLAQQLNNTLISTPSATAQSHGGQPAIVMIAKKINGTNGASTSPATYFATPTLGHALDSTTPMNSGETATSIALDTQAQDQAIQAAQVSMVNTVNAVRTGAFGFGSSHGHK